MTRPDLAIVPEFYKNYVRLVNELDVIEALEVSMQHVDQMVRQIPESKGAYRYMEDKWTVKEVLSHMMDAERVFAYRALRFSRFDETPLAPFDENSYAPRANAHSRSVSAIGSEMKRLRATTLDLFKSFNQEMMDFSGTASGKKISVLHLGYIIAGHDMHHCQILNDRYLK